MPGLGTLLNVATVLAGASIGALAGDRVPRRAAGRRTPPGPPAVASDIG